MVDESAMADTHDLVRIHAHCQEVTAKLLLTGDHHQRGLLQPGSSGLRAAGPFHAEPGPLIDPTRIAHP